MLLLAAGTTIYKLRQAIRRNRRKYARKKDLREERQKVENFKKNYINFPDKEFYIERHLTNSKSNKSNKEQPVEEEYRSFNGNSTTQKSRSSFNRRAARGYSRISDEARAFTTDSRQAGSRNRLSSNIGRKSPKKTERYSSKFHHSDLSNGDRSYNDALSDAQISSDFQAYQNSDGYLLGDNYYVEGGESQKGEPRLSNYDRNQKMTMKLIGNADEIESFKIPSIDAEGLEDRQDIEKQLAMQNFEEETGSSQNPSGANRKGSMAPSSVNRDSRSQNHLSSSGYGASNKITPHKLNQQGAAAKKLNVNTGKGKKVEKKKKKWVFRQNSESPAGPGGEGPSQRHRKASKLTEFVVKAIKGEQDLTFTGTSGRGKRLMSEYYESNVQAEKLIGDDALSREAVSQARGQDHYREIDIKPVFPPRPKMGAGNSDQFEKRGKRALDPVQSPRSKGLNPSKKLAKNQQKKRVTEKIESKSVRSQANSQSLKDSPDSRQDLTKVLRKGETEELGEIEHLDSLESAPEVLQEELIRKESNLKQISLVGGGGGEQDKTVGQILLTRPEGYQSDDSDSDNPTHRHSRKITKNGFSRPSGDRLGISGRDMADTVISDLQSQAILTSMNNQTSIAPKTGRDSIYHSVASKHSKQKTLKTSKGSNPMNLRQRINSNIRSLFNGKIGRQDSLSQYESVQEEEHDDNRPRNDKDETDTIYHSIADDSGSRSGNLTIFQKSQNRSNKRSKKRRPGRFSTTGLERLGKRSSVAMSVQQGVNLRQGLDVERLDTGDIESDSSEETGRIGGKKAKNRNKRQVLSRKSGKTKNDGVSINDQKSEFESCAGISNAGSSVFGDFMD